MICTLSPAYTGYEETASTLCFALRVKGMALRPVRNEAGQIDGAFLMGYERQLEDLRKKLKKMDISGAGDNK